MERVFTNNKIDYIINFAGPKDVGETVANRLAYYGNNINGVLAIVNAMHKLRWKNIIFSSNPTVNGNSVIIPISEVYPKGMFFNPYSWAKLKLEQMLMDVRKADSDWNEMFLSYFYPISTNESELIGENPNDIPNSLKPYISQTGIGMRKELTYSAIITRPLAVLAFATTSLW